MAMLERMVVVVLEEERYEANELGSRSDSIIDS